MRLLILLVIVGVCFVSAKYLPDETNNFKQLLSRHKRSDSEDSLDDSSSNDTDSISDEELKEQSKLHARLEKMRQKLLEKQEKERRRQELEQQKLEDKIARELQREEEKRQKEEERRQKELKKEEERRLRELQKEEERRLKEEEKRLQELQKHEEKLEKERRKLDEQQKKLKEKALENERKQQEMLQKQLKEMEEETLKLEEGDSSDSDADESTELEDFWKSYIYSKYGINESDTDLEKRIALRRYMQEELGLNVNSTESERRQAILRLIESKWQAVSEQYALQSQMSDFVNRVGVEKIRAQLEKEIEEINNKTDTLSSVNLPWVPLARSNYAEQVSFLQTIKEFMASIVPNWDNENTSSPKSTLNEAFSPNETISSVAPENQNVLESSVVSSDINKNDDTQSNITKLNDKNSPPIPNGAIDTSIGTFDKKSSPTFGSGSTAFDGSVTNMGTDKPSSSIGTGVDNNTPVESGTVANNVDSVSTAIAGSGPDSANEMSSVIDPNTNGVVTPTSEATSSNVINNKESSSVISRDAPTPALVSATSGSGPYDEQGSTVDGTVNSNSDIISNQDSFLNSVRRISDLATPINDLVLNKAINDDLYTSPDLNNIKNVDEISSSISENSPINTDIGNSLPPTDGINNNLNQPKGLGKDPDSSVTAVPNNNLSNIVSSLLTTEASEVVLPEAVLEKRTNSDVPQSSVNNVPEANNNQVLDTLLPKDDFNKVNMLPPTTESSGFNIITSIGDATGITNNVGQNSSSASNIVSGASEDASFASTNDNNLIVSLPPVVSTESQDSPVSINNDVAKPINNNITTDPSATDLTENSNKIIDENAGFVYPIGDVASENKNKENISSISTDNNKETITIPENTSEQPKTTDNTSIDNFQLENGDVISKVNDQNISKTLDVSENQYLNEPGTTFSTIDLEHVSTVSEATFENHAFVSSTPTPSSVATGQIDETFEGANAINTDATISNNKTTEVPPSIIDTQTTILDQSTSVPSNDQQLGNNNVAENQNTEKDATLPDTLSIMTEIVPNEVESLPTTSIPETGKNDSIKEQQNTIDNITVPAEDGASVIAIAQQ